MTVSNPASRAISQIVREFVDSTENAVYRNDWYNDGEKLGPATIFNDEIGNGRSYKVWNFSNQGMELLIERLTEAGYKASGSFTRRGKLRAHVQYKA